MARTPLDRLLTAGVLPDARQQELSARVQQLDPLRLSEHLDVLRYELLCHTHWLADMVATRPRLDFILAICTARQEVAQEAEPEVHGPQDFSYQLRTRS